MDPVLHGEFDPPDGDAVTIAFTSSRDTPRWEVGEDLHCAETADLI
jgi:hypothetical protein